MMVNEWSVENGAATWRGRKKIGGQEASVMLSVYYDPHGRATANMAESLRPAAGGRLLQDINERTVRPGFYVKLMVNGLPCGTLRLVTGKGETDKPGPETPSIQEFARCNTPEHVLESLSKTGKEPAGREPREQDLRPENEHIQVSMQSMIGWTGTPSIERLTSAAVYLQMFPETKPGAWTKNLDRLGRGAEVIADAGALADLYRTQRYHDWAKRVLSQQLPLTPDGEEMNRLTAEITKAGESDTTIGIHLEQGEPGRGNRMGSTYLFSRIQRDPDWMGMCAALPNAKELRLAVVESKMRPGRPGMVLNAERANTHGLRPFPQGEAQLLRDILNWHGAAECLWAAL